LALVCGSELATGNDASPVLLGRSFKQWITRLESQQPQQRVEAAWAIAQLAMDFPDAPKILLVHDDATVRYWGVHGLQRIVLTARNDDRHRGSARAGLKSALSDSSPAVRVAAAESLALAGDATDSVPVLTAAMAHPQDAVRIQAVSALEKLGEAARPAAATLRAATSDSSEYVKRISARALQKLDAAKK
jgi:HEAT repeat protein